MSTIETAGKVIDQIDVSISYRIIELFSAGLYSSPNKAFEELVCNSYDAFADKVSVYVPPDLSAEGAAIWVCDNGEGMDQQGLKDLWKIGESGKRVATREQKRLQIGRFGIGKLATYVLSNKLTYVSKRSGKFLAVTMNYLDIGSDTEDLLLDERELSEAEAQECLSNYLDKPGIGSVVDFELFGADAEESWTFTVMAELKPKALEIREGRLKWVLRTALPLNPAFQLNFNGKKVESSKVDRPILKRWVIGQDDETADATDSIECGVLDETPVLHFPNLKNVHGEISLYQDSLVDGKSSQQGRSHGIFLLVRGRLINLDDPLLGMEAFSHGAFNRTRIVVHADGLDDNLTSTREAIKESPPYNQLKDYIKRKFNNEIRKFHFAQLEKDEKEEQLSYRLARTSLTASKRPLLVFAEKYFNEEIVNPLLIVKPNKENKDALLEELRSELSEEQSFIKSVEWNVAGAGDPIAGLDLESGELSINLLHPYIANYIEEYKSKLPLQFVAITEVLTEAHLYELGIDESDVNSIMRRRDSTLRELSLSDREGTPAVAQMLRDAIADPTGLEDAVTRAFISLGFEASKIGGNGKPDGLATANLGYSVSNENQSYSLTYDAKSTGKKKIQANTANLSTINKHKSDYNADFAVVVAVDYEGSDDPDSTISVTSNQQAVTTMRASDLVRLLLLSAPKQIGLNKIRDLFDSCYSPLDVKNWIDEVQEDVVDVGPVKELLETIYDLQKSDTEPPEIASVRVNLNSKLPKGVNLSKDRIRAMIESLETFIPGFISLEGEQIGIQGTPDKIFSVVSAQINASVPGELQEIYLEAFSEMNTK